MRLSSGGAGSSGSGPGELANRTFGRPVASQSLDVYRLGFVLSFLYGMVVSCARVIVFKSSLLLSVVVAAVAFPFGGGKSSLPLSFFLSS